MTKTKTTARSEANPGAPRTNPSGLPYGAGSMQIRGRVWWMIYRDPEGRVIQENTKTDDASAARKMLVTKALETARARVLALEALLDETEGHNTGSEAGAGSGTSRRRSRDVAAQGSSATGGKQ